jgi:hypothetical protein
MENNWYGNKIEMEIENNLQFTFIHEYENLRVKIHERIKIVNSKILKILQIQSCKT